MVEVLRKDAGLPQKALLASDWEEATDEEMRDAATRVPPLPADAIPRGMPEEHWWWFAASGRGTLFATGSGWCVRSWRVRGGGGEPDGEQAGDFVCEGWRRLADEFGELRVLGGGDAKVGRGAAGPRRWGCGAGEAGDVGSAAAGQVGVRVDGESEGRTQLHGGGPVTQQPVAGPA